MSGPADTVGEVDQITGPTIENAPESAPVAPPDAQQTPPAPEPAVEPAAPSEPAPVEPEPEPAVQVMGTRWEVPQ